jgi:1-acyl-sn-glycerol-3-phosphate acyltransferase
MRYRFFKCNEPFVRKNADRIIEIAQFAFDAIPVEEVQHRIEKYDEVILVLSPEGRIEGFNFCSLHRNQKSLVIGGRLAAIDPVHKGKGYLRTASLYMFARFYWMFFKEFVQGKTTQLYIFSRLCNPIAYCLVHGGQEIYPDLVKNGPNEHHFPGHIVNQYQFLSRELGLNELNPKTGIIYQGASEAGIDANLEGFRKKWATSWEEYVPEGSELISLIPVTPGFPLRYSFFLLRRFIKIALKKPSNNKPRGNTASVLILLSALLTSVAGFLLLAVSCKGLARRLVKACANLALKLYGIELEIEGKFPAETGIIYAARHCSLLDTFIYPAILPHNTIIIAKHELSRFPILSQFFSAIGGIYVKRQKPLAAMRELKSSAAKLKSYENIFVHPEGTRYPENKVGKLFPGLFFRGKETEIVVPISSFGGAALWPRGQLYSQPGKVKIVIGESIKINVNESADPTAAIKDSYLQHIKKYGDR